MFGSPWLSDGSVFPSRRSRASILHESSTTRSMWTTAMSMAAAVKQAKPAYQQRQSLLLGRCRTSRWPCNPPNAQRPPLRQLQRLREPSSSTCDSWDDPVASAVPRAGRIGAWSSGATRSSMLAQARS